MCGSGRPTFHSPKSSWMNAWNSASSPETLRAEARESARARARARVRARGAHSAIATAPPLPLARAREDGRRA